MMLDLLPNPDLPKPVSLQAKTKFAPTVMPKQKLADVGVVTNSALLAALKESRAIGEPTEQLQKLMNSMMSRFLSSKWADRTSGMKQQFHVEMANNLMKSWSKFDDTKSNNPFAFFTTSMYSSCLGVVSRMAKEELSDHFTRAELRHVYEWNGHEYRIARIMQDGLVLMYKRMPQVEGTSGSSWSAMKGDGIMVSKDFLHDQFTKAAG